MMIKKSLHSSRDSKRKERKLLRLQLKQNSWKSTKQNQTASKARETRRMKNKRRAMMIFLESNLMNLRLLMSIDLLLQVTKKKENLVSFQRISAKRKAKTLMLKKKNLLISRKCSLKPL